MQSSRIASPAANPSCDDRAFMASSASAAAPWQSGLRGARANLVPGLILQAAALALVVGYYREAPIQAALAKLVEFRIRAGFAFGIVSTGLVAGVLPFLYLRYAGPAAAVGRRYGWTQGLGLTAFWAYKGFEVDVWYRLQAHVVGPGHDAATIAIKVFLDQFVYCPVFAVPVTAAVYELVDTGYDGSALASDIRTPRWYRRRVLPILISNLGVWIPAVAIIYALPTPLQLPLQNIVLCFYTLIVAHQTKAEADRRDGGAKPAAAGVEIRTG